MSLDAPAKQAEWTRHNGPKDPVKAYAGRRGALARWGAEPRTVRIGDLTDSQRRRVLDFIAGIRMGSR